MKDGYSFIVNYYLNATDTDACLVYVTNLKPVFKTDVIVTWWVRTIKGGKTKTHAVCLTRNCVYMLDELDKGLLDKQSQPEQPCQHRLQGHPLIS